MIATREKLQLLWVFLFLNFIFCDVFTLFHGPTLTQLMSGTVDGMAMTQPALLGFAVLMELGMVMVLVSRLAPFGAARRANLVVGLLLIVVQTVTVLTPGLTLHYAFFSAVEIATLAWIVLIARRWSGEAASHVIPAAAGIQGARP
jgi:hypothetical protein